MDIIDPVLEYTLLLGSHFAKHTDTMLNCLFEVFFVHGAFVELDRHQVLI